MARQPVIPKSVSDPTGLNSLNRRALKEMKRKFSEIKALYLDFLGRIPFEAIAVNTIYQFNLLPSEFQAMLNNANQDIEQILTQGGKDNLWLLNGYVAVAYNNGLEKARVNIGAQSVEYSAYRPSLDTIIMSQPYRTRMEYLALREFEEMVGLSDIVKKDLAQTLTYGMASGQNPKEIAKQITKRTGVHLSRANTIARTEINMAFKRARMDEAQDSMQRFGFNIRMLHLSAMTRTTRRTHAMRNGEINTIEEVNEWNSRDGNAINCLCSITEVLVDDDGKPLTTIAIDRVRSRKLVYAGSNA